MTRAGQHVRLNGPGGGTRPMQRPAPPILVGAGGRRMLALAARQADIVSAQVTLSPGGAFDLGELRAGATVLCGLGKVGRKREERRC